MDAREELATTARDLNTLAVATMEITLALRRGLHIKANDRITIYFRKTDPMD